MGTATSCPPSVHSEQFGIAYDGKRHSSGLPDSIRYVLSKILGLPGRGHQSNSIGLHRAHRLALGTKPWVTRATWFCCPQARGTVILCEASCPPDPGNDKTCCPGHPRGRVGERSAVATSYPPSVHSNILALHHTENGFIGPAEWWAPEKPVPTRLGYRSSFDTNDVPFRSVHCSRLTVHYFAAAPGISDERSSPDQARNQAL